MQDKILVAILIVDFDVVEIGMNAQGEVGREGPRRGGPGQERGIGIIDQRK